MGRLEVGGNGNRRASVGFVGIEGGNIRREDFKLRANGDGSVNLLQKKCPKFYMDYPHEGF